MRLPGPSPKRVVDGQSMPVLSVKSGVNKRRIARVAETTEHGDPCCTAEHRSTLSRNDPASERQELLQLIGALAPLQMLRDHRPAIALFEPVAQQHEHDAARCDRVATLIIDDDRSIPLLGIDREALALKRQT